MRTQMGMWAGRPAEDGASAVEYGLLIAGVAALLATIVWLFGGVVLEMFTDTCDGLHAKASTTATC